MELKKLKTWFKARETCWSMGGDLAVPTTNRDLESFVNFYAGYLGKYQN